MTRLPTLFISHGSPMFALDPGLAGPRLTALGQRLPRPEAVLVVSPHWMTREPRVAITPAPQTLHDFGGFVPKLHTLTYPAPGHPALALRAQAVLKAAGCAAETDAKWGLDHGAWVPLRYLYPQADVPVFQVSQPKSLDGASAYAYAYGQALASLREEGVLIVGSGSLTHNLREIRQEDDRTVDGCVVEFADWIAQTVLTRDHVRLQQTMTEAPHAQRAHPTAEHLWPLIVAAGAAGERASSSRIEGGFTYGVLSMDAYVFGNIA